MIAHDILSRLGRDDRGSVVVETAIIVPVLALLSLGTFEASAMISRQSELQQAVAEAAQIALVSAPDTQSERNTIKSIIRSSTGLADSNVTITTLYRCGANTATQATSGCGTSATTTYIKIVVTDTFTPFWTDFGVGGPISYNITRTVIVA